MDKIYHQPDHLWKGQKGRENQRNRVLKSRVDGLYKKLSQKWARTSEVFHYDLFELRDGQPYFTDKPLTTRDGKLRSVKEIKKIFGDEGLRDLDEMHQFDLLYMPSDTLYGNKYKYIPAGIDAASRYKVARPLRTKQVRDVAEMIADIYKVGPLTYPKIFQCDNGSEFKGEMTKMLEKHEVKIQRVTTKYKHAHTAFVEALNKILA